MASVFLRFRHGLLVVLSAGVLLTLSACTQKPVADVTNAVPVENISKHAETINNLKKGGYVIFFRHTKTEPGNFDEQGLVVTDCSTQRTLSEEGWLQARAIGKAIAAMHIPVGDVYSSEVCRAWQTADLIFGKYAKNSALNLNSAKRGNETDEQKRNRAIALLSKIPPKGINTVLMSHSVIFEGLTNQELEPEGAAYILRPDGKSFEIVDLIAPDEWSQLSW